MAELYRHYDYEDVLLYVGVSISTAARLAQHRDHSRWFENVHRVTITRYDTRESALIAEKLAIQAERPVWNVHHNSTLKQASQLTAPSPSTRSTEMLTGRLVRFKALYTVPDAASELGLTSETVRGCIANGRLGHVSIVGPSGFVRTYITGFQLITFLEPEV